jgi:hypothetical protein
MCLKIRIQTFLGHACSGSAINELREELEEFFLLWNSVEESGPEEWVRAAISLAQV